MHRIGYRQTWEMLEGSLPNKELRDRGIYATRQLTKRQLTWINNQDWQATVLDCLAEGQRKRLGNHR